MLPSARTTRWHGTTTGSGLVAQAVPTARTALRVAGQLGDGGVAGGVPVADLGQVVQHRAPEPGRQPPVQRQVERVPAAREVLVEFAGGRVQPAGGAEDARADLVGQRLQHGVVALEGEGHPDQALLGGGQQQRADRAVDRSR